jgi:hypothetical protein
VAWIARVSPVTFAEWQASRGIMPWPEVHARAGQDLRFTRALRRLGWRMNGSVLTWAALGVATLGAAMRVAEFAEAAEAAQLQQEATGG